MDEIKRNGKHWGHLGTMVFLLLSSATEPNATPSTSSAHENRSIDDRTSHEFCAYRYVCNIFATLDSNMNWYFNKTKLLLFCICTGHIGSNDTELTPNHMNAIQSQMQSKGGYETNSLRIQVILLFASRESHILSFNIQNLTISISIHRLAETVADLWNAFTFNNNKSNNAL